MNKLRQNDKNLNHICFVLNDCSQKEKKKKPTLNSENIQN